MRRIVPAVAVVVCWLGVAPAAAAPSPSPPLKTIVVAPTDPLFTNDPTALPFEGTFTAPQWAALAGTNAPQVEADLHKDGFVEGFAWAWYDSSHNHLLVEGVAAFTGARGANNWLAANVPQASDANYVHSISVSGADSVAAAHYAQPAVPFYSDTAVFVKGNDYFFLAAESKTDDLGDIAATQTKRQYDVAPANSIPPAQWPENATVASSSPDLASTVTRYAAFGFVAAAILVLVVVGAVFLLTRRRAPAADSAYAPMAPAGMPAGVQMSADGYYWWDGRGWRDASREAPPTAQRSGDGYYWWDGRTWRPVPGTTG